MVFSQFQRRILRSSVAILAAVGIAVSTASSASAFRVFDPAPGKAPQAGITVKTERWNPASNIRLHGTSWTPNEVVEIRLAPTYRSVRADAKGEFYLTITVPWVAPGSYPLQGIGTKSNAVTTFAFPVQAFNVWAEPSTYYAKAGTAVSFTGHRFANGETVDVRRDNTIIASAKADALGEFKNVGSYKLPAADAGKDVNYTFTGRRSHAVATAHTSVAPGNGTSGTTTSTTTRPSTTSTTTAPTTTTVVTPTTSTPTTSTPATTTAPTTTVTPTTNVPTTTTPPTTSAPATTVPPTTSAPTTTSTTAAPTTTTTIPGDGVPPVTEPAAPVTLGASGLVDMLPGQSLWQSVNWVGSSTNDACDFRVVVDPQSSFTVVYPSDRGYTSPPESSTLKRDEKTYTAIRLRPNNNVNTPTALTLTATYTPCDRGTPTGVPVVQSETITVPVTPPNSAFVQNTTEVGPFNTNSTDVVEISYTSYSADVTNFKLRVTDASGGTIYYPEGRDFTSPFKKDSIDITDTDYVGFRINLDGLTPGLKILKLRVTYGPDGATKDSTLAVNVA